MPKRYFVLDQNKLRAHRAPEVVCLLETSPDTHFVLPDVAFVEMTKNPEHRAATVNASLEMLAPYRHRVHIARAIGESLRTELDQQRSVTSQMMFREGTVFGRKILQSLNEDIDGKELSKIGTDPDDHHSDLAKDYFNHSLNKERVAELIDDMKRALSDGYQKDLRANRISRDDQLNVLHEKAPALLCNILQADLNMSAERAWKMVKRKPMLLRYFYSKMWLCMDWIKNGGFESIPEEKISNDLVDHEYIMTATCFDGMISAEKRVMDAYQDMTALLSKSIVRPKVSGGNISQR